MSTTKKKFGPIGPLDPLPKKDVLNISNSKSCVRLSEPGSSDKQHLHSNPDFTTSAVKSKRREEILKKAEPDTKIHVG